MALAFLRVDGGDDGKVEDDEIALGEPDAAEAESLPLHVARCAKRYRVTIRRLNRIDRALGRLTFVGLSILSWLVLTSPEFAAAWKALGL